VGVFFNRDIVLVPALGSSSQTMEPSISVGGNQRPGFADKTGVSPTLSKQNHCAAPTICSRIYEESVEGWTEETTASTMATMRSDPAIQNTRQR